MNFQALIDAIHQAWSFAWPPISFLIISLLIIYLLNPVTALNRFRVVSHNLSTFGTKFKKAHEVLDPFGLSKLIPLISGITFIFILYVINGPYLIVCKQIPPQFGNREEVLVEEMVTLDEKIQLIRMYPRCISFKQAYFLAVAKLIRKDYDLYYLEKIAFYEKMIGLIKGLLPIIAFFFLFNWRSKIHWFNKFVRLLLIIVVWVLSLYATLVAHKYHKQQHQKVEINAMRDALAEKPWIANAPLTDIEKSKLTDHKDEQWYVLYFIGGDRINWFKANWDIWN